jgi:hypothetical protein
MQPNLVGCRYVQIILMEPEFHNYANSRSLSVVKNHVLNQEEKWIVYRAFQIKEND